MQNPTTPVERLFRIPLWVNNTRYRNMRPTDRIVDTALLSFKLQINEWSIADFINHYFQSTPLFGAKTTDDLNNVYLTI